MGELRADTLRKLDRENDLLFKKQRFLTRFLYEVSEYVYLFKGRLLKIMPHIAYN